MLAESTVRILLGCKWLCHGTLLRSIGLGNWRLGRSPSKTHKQLCLLIGLLVFVCDFSQLMSDDIRKALLIIMELKRKKKWVRLRTAKAILKYCTGYAWEVSWYNLPSNTFFLVHVIKWQVHTGQVRSLMSEGYIKHEHWGKKSLGPGVIISQILHNRQQG